MAKIVDGVIRRQYSWGEYQPHFERQAGEPLDIVTEDLTGAESDEVARALANQLIVDDDYRPQDGETFYADDQNYIRNNFTYYHHSFLWEKFCKSIVHSQRFFNANAKQLISELFEGIHNQRDHRKRFAVYEIKPGRPNASFFRARLAEDDKKIKEIASNPEQQLGPPPERYRRAGRMNPSGIGCFYAAFDLPTCTAELRPAVGSTVVGAKFKLIRPIQVLDTTRFAAPMKPLSVFSKNYLARVEQWSFLQQFCREIAKPISKNDEHLDYIPTQAVAEYFLHHHEFKRRGRPGNIEAIIFQSAQYPKGRNIVLLGDAAQVEFPQSRDSNKSGASALDDVFSGAVENFLDGMSQPKNPAIRVLEDSVEIHQVTGARYNTERQSFISFNEDYEF